METLGCLLIVLPLFYSPVSGFEFLENQFCNPHPTLIPIDHPQYNHYPYFVKLNRCGGACGTTSPNIAGCVPEQTENVTIKVYDLSNKSPPKLIRLVNHTKCGCQCVVRPEDCNAAQKWHKGTCECKCKYRDTPPSPCPKGQQWNSEKCECECHRAPEVCPVGKSWSVRDCACVCNGEMVSKCKRYGMAVDENCKCKAIQVGANTGEKPKEIPKVGKLTLVLMLGEFVLLCLIFDAILYHRNTGITYSIAKKLGCKSQSKGIKSHGVNMGNDNADISSVSTRDEYDEKV